MKTDRSMDVHCHLPACVLTACMVWLAACGNEDPSNIPDAAAQEAPDAARAIDAAPPTDDAAPAADASLPDVQLAQSAYVKASNTGLYDWFGRSIALSGDTLVVGAYKEDSAATGIDGNQADNAAMDAGAVYVFRRIGSSWVQEAYLKASNTDPIDGFGYSVAIAGDTLAVSAHGESSAATGVNGDQASNAAQSSGAVYVFRRTGSTWAQEAYIKASNTDAGDWFGYSLALSDDTLAVGAMWEASAATGVNGNQSNNSAEYSGAVYVFRRTGSTWAQEAYIKASNTEISDHFGASVALSGDTLAVGAPLEDSSATGIGGAQINNNAEDSGAVYVFRRTGSAWAQEAYIKASNTNLSDFFGYSVALSGDSLAVGASGEDGAATGIGGDQADNLALGSGAVYAFRRTGTTWAQEAYIKASNTGAGDEFGHSVALSGDILAVGAPEEDSAATGIDGDQASNSVIGSGAAYMFRHNGSAWAQETYVKASNASGFDRFGWNVVISDDTFAASAYTESGGSTSINGDQSKGIGESGAVYIFH